MKTNVFIVNYRGYGESEGKPSEDGIAIDAKATMEYVLRRKEIDNRKIYLFGRSLGAAVGI